jgi:predicted DNA-binding transcriptional regulator
MDTGLIELVRTCVRSVWALELLFFLRAHQGQAWTAERLVREQRSSERAVRDALDAFVRAGLVRPGDAGFAYQPASPELDSLVARLAETYAERPTAVIRMIVAAPEDRLQAFLDAFRLKRD